MRQLADNISSTHNYMNYTTTFYGQNGLWPHGIFFFFYLTLIFFAFFLQNHSMLLFNNRSNVVITKFYVASIVRLLCLILSDNIETKLIKLNFQFRFKLEEKLERRMERYEDGKWKLKDRRVVKGNWTGGIEVKESGTLWCW